MERVDDGLFDHFVEVGHEGLELEHMATLRYDSLPYAALAFLLGIVPPLQLGLQVLNNRVWLLKQHHIHQHELKIFTEQFLFPQLKLEQLPNLVNKEELLLLGCDAVDTVLGNERVLVAEGTFHVVYVRDRGVGAEGEGTGG